ncbi:3202_t:CDS:2 [Acaulospora morrowiae]|uniref:3202_t:CDS:1 n=1 Tax=Acaulospora morrowiae TaxID=94023 RepID=A0A9N8V8D8_9GLOM|nr:3202_t:CDS:2 [Acaulospora morrowiae]
MTPLFPPEIYRNVFKLLDTNSLHSCLHVSRLWCTHVIPLLWQNPLQIVFNKEGPHVENVSSIVETYLSCLSSDSRVKLVEGGIVPPMRAPTFKYHKYLNSLNYWLFHDAISTMFLKESPIQKRTKKKLMGLILEELLKLFFNHSENIRNLEYGTPEVFDYRNLEQSLDPVFILPNELSDCDIFRLSKLKSFSCRADTPPELIYTISRVSKGLQKIDIQQESNDEALSALIDSQTNLQHFEMTTCSEAKKVLSALKKKSKTLRKVSITGGCAISFDFFLQCPNLEELSLLFPVRLPGSERKWISLDEADAIWNCTELPSLLEYHIQFLAVLHGQALQYQNIYSSQVESSLSSEKDYISPQNDEGSATIDTARLMRLEIRRSNQRIKKIIDLIKISSGTLKTLTLDLTNSKDPEKYPHLISTIIQLCSNLVSIHLYIPNQSLSILPSLFIKCSKLEEILLTGDPDQQDISNVLYRLGPVVPRRLQFLALGVQTWTYNMASINNFFHHCKDRIDNLPFNFALDINSKSDFFKLCEKYRKKGSHSLMMYVLYGVDSVSIDLGCRIMLDYLDDDGNWFLYLWACDTFDDRDYGINP